MAVTWAKRWGTTSVGSMAAASVDPTGDHWDVTKAVLMVVDWVVSLVRERVALMAARRALPSVGGMGHKRVDRWVFPLASTMAAS